MEAFMNRDWDGGPVRYPDPAIEILDPRFEDYPIGNSAVERLWTGCRWAEGPAGLVWRWSLSPLERYSQ